MARTITVLALASALAGCSNRLEDPRFATGSATIAASADARAVYAVNVDEGTITRADRDGGVTTLAVGREPTRLARVGNRLLVTLRGERGIAVVEDEGGALRLDRVVRTGTEPYGIVASEDGARVFVALSTQNEVHELDGATLEVVRRWQIPGEPHWLALHPSGRSLYVGSAFGGLVHHVDLDDDAPPAPLPSVDTTAPNANPLTRRVTGDLAISPDGLQLAIPGLHVDNLTEVGDGSLDEDGDGVVTGGYGSVGTGVSRMNPVVGFVALGRDGDPRGPIEPVLFSGAVESPSSPEGFETVRSYPSSATYAPDGATVWLTLEASGAVAALPTVPMFIAPRDGVTFEGDPAAGPNGFAVATPALVQTDVGPRGVVFTDDGEPWVHAFLDRSVAPIDAATALQLVESSFNGPQFDVDPFMTAGRALPSTAIEVASLPIEVEHGRRLFYSATDDRMAGAGAGVSCSTCHFDGRNDGVTWHTHAGDSGFRNTPSLVGGTSDTAPVTWAENVASVADEAEITSQTRMGGFAIGPEDLRAIEAFVDQQRLPDLPDQDDAAVARGAEVFARAGCDACHAGPAFVDGQPHRVVDLAVDTPTLRGIGATAPYLHDGSAPTLEAVLVLSDAGLMGDTSALSDAEKADLLAYLRAL